MALCPFAKHQLIAPGDNDPRITARVAIWHVAVSMLASLFRYFNGPSGGIESHFYINWRGKLIQYRDTGWQADANYQANDFAVSVETAGWAAGKWNRAQRKTMQRLALWLNEAEGIPLAKCQTWDGSGHGYHTQFGAPGPWTPVSKSCPGPERIRQFNNWFVPWLTSQARTATGEVTTEEDDMPSVMDFMRHHLTKKGDLDVAEALRSAARADDRARRIEAAVKEIGKGLGPTVEKAVNAALTDAVIDVAVTVKHPEEK